MSSRDPTLTNLCAAMDMQIAIERANKLDNPEEKKQYIESVRQAFAIIAITADEARTPSPTHSPPLTPRNIRPLSADVSETKFAVVQIGKEFFFHSDSC